VISASFGLTSLNAAARDNVVSPDEAELLVGERNELPIAVPGEGFEVEEDGDGYATVTVDGSSSADPDGTIKTYLWTLKGEWLSNDAVATVRLPVGTHRLLLTVTDDKGDTGEAKIRIRVKRRSNQGAPDDEQQPEPETDQVQDDTGEQGVELPPAPYRVEAKQKNTEVAITWKVDPDVPAPYRIYRAIDDEIDDPELTVEEEYDALHWILIREEWEKLSYRDADVQVGVPYLYTVRSFDGVDESERSNVAAITVQQIDEEPVGEAPPEEPGADPTEPPVQEAPPTNTPVPDTPTPVPDTPTPVPDTPTPVVEPEVEEPPPDEEAEAEG
jgi:hypothetical protein